jgi:DNA-binding LacI/PurR family transcriptional regulator
MGERLLGRSAAKMLMDMLLFPEKNSVKHTIGSCTLVEGDSVGEIKKTKRSL